ncbi:MAG TPA: iron-containing redox enzyme family protein [Chloroflexota bacterium]
MSGAEGFKRELKTIVDERHCSQHPLVEAWAAGTLPKEVLGRWAQEHYHFTKDLWAFLAATYANCPHSDVRATIMENLSEEIDPADPHLQILLGFASACGVSPEEIKASKPLPTTWGLKDWLTRISTRQSWIESAAGMHIGMESQMPTMAAKIIPALREKYGLSESDIRFFTLHHEADQEHGGRIYELVGKYATTPEVQEAVRQAVREGTQKRWLYYDGVYIKYVLGYPIDVLPA